MKQGTTAKGDYTYDGRQRLATRVVSNVTGANGTSHILHGYVGCPEPMNENALQGGVPCDRILAETDGTGAAGAKREYIWLGDMPVAVIDKTVTPNKTYMVHADHLNRPYFMTDSTRAVVFKAFYEPFGTVYSTTGTASLNTLRFPGQWFQLESGLAYNWHRHYDATLGRYVSADPLGLVDGASVYGYVGQRPSVATDPTGRYTAVIGLGIRLVGGRAATAVIGTFARQALGPIGTITACITLGACQYDSIDNSPNVCPVPGGTREPDTKGRAKIWSKPGTYSDAVKDFDDLVGPENSTPLPNGGKRGKLPDGRDINVRPESSDGRPSIEIMNPGGKGRRDKIRYTE